MEITWKYVVISTLPRHIVAVRGSTGISTSNGRLIQGDGVTRLDEGRRGDTRLDVVIRGYARLCEVTWNRHGHGGGED